MTMNKQGNDLGDPTWVNPNLCSHCKQKNRMRGKDLCSLCNKNIAKANNLIDMDIEDVGVTSIFQRCEKCGLDKAKTTYNFRPDNLKVCKECRKSCDSDYRREHIKSLMLYAAKKRAQDKSLDFSLTQEDLPSTLPELCPVLGIPMEVSQGLQSDNSFSLDRIDNSRGYIRGNVEVISWKANRLKNNATPDDLRKILAYMEGRHIPTS